MANTREENAHEMARDEARNLIRRVLVKDMADSLRDDPDFREQTAEEGWGGFVHMLNEQLIEAAIDADLHERNEVAEAIELLSPGRLG